MPSSPPDRIRRFVVETGQNLVPDGRRRVASREDAAGIPVAEAVMDVPGIQELVVEGNTVTALRRDDASWDRLEERVRYAIGAAIQHGAPPPPADGPPLSDDELFDTVDRILRRDINPAVAGHGGKVELVDVQDGTAVVRMMGGCQGCGMANVTLRQGIEAQLRRAVPGFRGIRDITDHASGTNPYW